MAKRKIIPHSGTLRLEAEPGYAANGMSLYSRTARKPRGGGSDLATKFRDRAPAHQPPRNSTVTELILRHRHELAKLVDKLNGDLTPAERAKAESNREIKIRFLEKLSAEYEDMIRAGANYERP